MKKRAIKSLILGLFLACVGSVSAQDAYDIFTPPSTGYRTRGEVVNGDTVSVVDIETIQINTPFQFRTKRHYEMWTRTKFNVKKVYPYAILAAAKLKEYDAALAHIEGERAKKTFIKKCEDDL